MFGIGGFELLVILVIAILFVKTEDLPGLIRGVRGVWQKCMQLYYELVDQFEFLDKKR